GQQRNSHPLTF
nr:immunoglobulin light chain junction region [Macaca mulatta]